LKPIVLDCSMAMAWCLQDERHDAAEALLDRLPGRTIFAPSIWLYEVFNVLAIAQRAGRLSDKDAEEAILYLTALDVAIEMSPSSMADAKQIHVAALRHGLTVYDAAYLTCAQNHDADLATLDAKLIKAAGNASVSLLR